jgi:hypothetical protein
MPSGRAAGVLTALLVLAGCAGEEEDGPRMSPGEECLGCHRPGTEAGAFTAAGTVFPTAGAAPHEGVESATVRLIDANGKQVALATNAAGNFFTHEALSFPVQVVLEWQGRTVVKARPVDSGACNGCHRVPPGGGAPGRIHLPQ